jgi:hypothetical protein
MPPQRGHEGVMASPRTLFRLAALSVLRFLRLATSRALRLRRHRVGPGYVIPQRGTYLIFRETVRDDGPRARSVVLVAGFRLRVLRSQRILHWLFQRACMLTTPFWSGFRGFRVKLWMVDPQTRKYLGISAWAGVEHAQTYRGALVQVLRPLSPPGSVWYELSPDQELEPFLRTRKRP